jgi:hypothetical protein
MVKFLNLEGLFPSYLERILILFFRTKTKNSLLVLFSIRISFSKKGGQVKRCPDRLF